MIMSHGIDLDAYCRRIGYAGDRSPTLATLRALQELHPRAIAFENLNPLLGWPVRLDAASLEDKLVKARRGGYCFEQNLLFRHALEALGYSVTGLAARVLWNQPEGAITARSHMLLRVEIDGASYLSDVGFGGQTPTGPLRLALDVEQQTPHEPFRLVPSGSAGSELRLEAWVQGSWRALYRFSLEEQFLVDYEVSNYFLSTSPTSHFKTRLFVARTLEDGRAGLFGDQLSTHRLGGASERRALTGVAEVREVLEAVFGIDVPRGAEVDATLRRSIEPPTATTAERGSGPT